MQAFSHIHVIQGKPTMSAEVMLAKIYEHYPNAPIDFEKLDDEGCVILAARPGRAQSRISFLKKDAERAGLLGKDSWKKYPRAMYRSRAVSEMARSLYPDVLMGVSYTPEELGAEVNDEGEVLETTATQSTPKQDEPTGVPFEGPVAAVGQPQEPKKQNGNGAKQPSTYEGTEEQQKIIAKVLAKEGISDEHYEAIHENLMGRPSTDLKKVVTELGLK